VVIGYILWPFGIFCGHWVYFVVIWYILWSLGILLSVLVGCTKKNLAALRRSSWSQSYDSCVYSYNNSDVVVGYVECLYWGSAFGGFLIDKARVIAIICHHSEMSLVPSKDFLFYVNQLKPTYLQTYVLIKIVSARIEHFKMFIIFFNKQLKAKLIQHAAVYMVLQSRRK
jgi:hypothetical protein